MQPATKREEYMKQVIETTSKFVITVLLALGASACQKKDEAANKNGQIKVKVSAMEQMDSAELTSSAEQLISPYTFMISHEMAKKALAKDPNNLKAEFIMLLTKRFQAFKGLHTRIRPALQGEQLKAHDEWLKKFPTSPLKTFLTAEGSPIKTITDSQSVLSEYYGSIQEFRNFLKKNQNSKLSLELNAQTFENEIREEMADSCVYVQGEDGNFTELVCDYSEIAVKKLNIADMIMLRQVISGELVYSLFNNYSLEGLDKIQQNEGLSNQEKTEAMARLPELGKLRSEHTFGLLRDIGSDLSAAVKWAVQYQKEVCPAGHESYNQRKGYLFKDGLCVEDVDATQKMIAVLDQALRGAVRVEMTTAGGNKIETNVNYFAWSDRPIRDLRQVMPTQWNECDEATEIRDNTLGGMFVDNNFNLTLDKKCE